MGFERKRDLIFVYDGKHRILICTTCSIAIKPGPKSQARHLRRQPHWKVGNIDIVLGFI